MSVTQSRDIVAALVWDRPALNRSADAGARSFAGAFDPRPSPVDDEIAGALADAARAVVADRAGATGTAQPIYSTLATSDDRWVSLLGLMLACWAPGTLSPQMFDRAITAATAVDDVALRTRLLMKLATYALDKLDAELFMSLLRRAYDIAPLGTRLRRAVVVVLANYSGEFPPELSEPEDVRPATDPLVDLEWISDLVTRSAQGELVELLKARARNPWSWSVRMGQTNVDVSLAAEAQATWAGALWMRDAVRRQVAAQLLAQASPSPYQTLFGLSMWIAGRGDDLAPILAAAEPSFESGTADGLVRLLLPLRTIPTYGDRKVLEVSNALWDLLSDEMTAEVMNLVPPEDARSPFSDAALFWSRAAIRIPDRWEEALRGIVDDDRVARVISQLSMTAVDRMRRETAEYILSRADVGEGDVGSFGLILLWHKLRLPIPDRVTVPVDAVLQVATWRPEAIVEPSYSVAETALREALVNTVNEARRGSFGFGAVSAAAGLASVAAARGAIEAESLALLTTVAKDVELAPHLRLDAILAVAEVAAHDLVSADVIADFAEVLPPTAPTPFGTPVSPALLSSAALAVRASVLTHEEQIRLFTLSRDPDARAREIVARVAARFLQRNASTSVEAALVAALFDPEPSVVAAALGGMRRVQLSEFSHDAVTARLIRILGQYGRYQRAEAVRAIAALAPVDQTPPLMEALRAASSDRSWIVRTAAAESAFSSSSESPGGPGR